MHASDGTRRTSSRTARSEREPKHRLRRATRIGKRGECGVMAAGPVHTRSGMRVRGSEVKTSNRRAVAKVGKDGAKEELIGQPRAAAGQVATDEIFVHGFEIGRR